jgi:hypothetical protein
LLIESFINDNVQCFINIFLKIGVKSGEVLLNIDLLPVGSAGLDKKEQKAKIITGMQTCFCRFVSILLYDT